MRKNTPSPTLPHLNGEEGREASSPLRGSRGEGPGARFLALLVCFLLAACSDDSKSSKLPVVIAADPPSLVAAQSITAELSTAESFFTKDISSPLTSDGGLVLESLDRQSARKALAIITSTETTEVGSHRFELSMGGETGVLDFSVVSENPGPGTVTAEGNTASAGANFAKLDVHGVGTHFDADCEVEVEGAPGLVIYSMGLQTETRFSMSYSISIDQEPAQATVRIIDGPYSYEVPFTIVPAAELDSTSGPQHLTKGRVGLITVTNPDSQMNTGTHFEPEDELVETGDAQVVDQTEVAIPVRVPFDCPSDSVLLEAMSYTEGGAFLELLNVSVDLLEPAYLAASPARFSSGDGEQVVDLEAQGVDPTAVDSLTLQTDDQFVLSAWEAVSATTGTATFVVGAGATDGGYSLWLDDGARIVDSTVAVSGSTADVFEAEEEITVGDHVYTTLVLENGNLLESDTVLVGDDDIEVVDLHWIDEGCVVAELAVSAEAYAGDTGSLHPLQLSSDGNDYTVYFTIVESGL